MVTRFEPPALRLAPQQVAAGDLTPLSSLVKDLLISYPRGGNLRAVPAGATRLELLTGKVIRPDGTEQMSSSLSGHGQKLARSISVQVDTDLDLEILTGGQSSGKVRVAQCCPLKLPSFALDTLVLSSDYPYNLQMAVGSNPGVLFEAAAPVAFQERFGEVTTTNYMTPLPVGPTRGGALAANYLKNEIYVGRVGTKVLTVNNSGSNSVDLNLRLLLIDGKTWADDPVTGASLTLGSGNTALLETGIPCQFLQLRVRSTTSGQHSTVEYQYLGITLLR